MNVFKDRLKLLRENKKISSKEFADALNVDTATISNWEAGRRFPKNEVLLEIADYFNVSLDYLLGRTDDEQVAIYRSEYKDLPLEIQVDKNYLSKLTPAYVAKLLEALEDAGFDLKKILNSKRKA